MMRTDPNQSVALSIELAQREGSVAAQLGTGKILEIQCVQGDRDKDSVMPAIDKAVSHVGGLPHSIDTVVVSVGPGGFTGLRIAVATSKMISLATGATLVPVHTALGIVKANGKVGTKSLVVSSVKRNSCWLSVVEKDQHWLCDGRLIDVEQIVDYLDQDCVLFGDSFLPEQTRIACDQIGVEVRAAVSSATSIMEVGLELLADGKTIDPSELLPLYPREPEAVRKWKEVNDIS